MQYGGENAVENLIENTVLRPITTYTTGTPPDTARSERMLKTTKM